MVMQLDDDSIWSEFANDAGEALAAIEGALLVLEDAPGRKDEINRLYRGLHTIKGNAGFLQLVAIEKLAHVAEDLIGLVRDHGVPLDGTVVDLMLRAVDRLRDGVGKVGRERRDLEPRQVEALVGEIAAAHAARTTAPATTAPASAAPPTVAAPAGPVIAAPVAPAPPAEPPIELIEPSLDPGYVEVFLSLCNELCPAIGEAVVGAAEPDGAAACAALVERCADLGLAAERMGYVHVQDALAQLARAIGEAVDAHVHAQRAHALRVHRGQRLLQQLIIQAVGFFQRCSGKENRHFERGIDVRQGSSVHADLHQVRGAHQQVSGRSEG